ncbi:MAG TPA: hypothetical protein VFD45_00205 [Patescibacteria group bacterium]|nr:hypothetical protein [Patescibacteria group bacterium]
MKKIIATTIIATILLVALITTATADENKNENQLEVKTQNIETSNENDTDPTKLQIKVKKHEGGQKKNWKGFEMRGVISNRITTSFKLNNITINMNPAITEKIHIKGTLKKGAFIKVEGKIIDGNYYAKEIKVEEKDGGGKDEKQDEDENDNVISPTISPGTSLISEPEVSVTPTPDASKSVKETSDKIDIKVTGSLEDIISILEDLINLLKNQVSLS